MDYILKILLMTKEEFIALLEDFDWWYMMSDSQKVIDKGEERKNQLERIAKENNFWEIYISFSNKIYKQ